MCFICTSLSPGIKDGRMNMRRGTGENTIKAEFSGLFTKTERLETIICDVNCCSEKLEELERAELCSPNAID